MKVNLSSTRISSESHAIASENDLSLHRWTNPKCGLPSVRLPANNGRLISVYFHIIFTTNQHVCIVFIEAKVLLEPILSSPFPKVIHSFALTLKQNTPTHSYALLPWVHVLSNRNYLPSYISEAYLTLYSNAYSFTNTLHTCPYSRTHTYSIVPTIYACVYAITRTCIHSHRFPYTCTHIP